MTLDRVDLGAQRHQHNPVRISVLPFIVLAEFSSMVEDDCGSSTSHILMFESCVKTTCLFRKGTSAKASVSAVDSDLVTYPSLTQSLRSKE